ncbi:MAG: GAF domain-containing protein, partial [Acidobacteria bacterium]|nr:GAF domain-containing protein [Acidobacteriota bacterium]
MEPLYKQVSAELIEELAEKLLDGRSIVLLGPRYAGKRRVIRHLQDVAKKNEERTIRLRFLSESAVDSEESVRGMIERALAESAFDGDGPGRLALRAGHRIFAPLDALMSSPRSRRLVYLFASNIDNLAHHVARSFLEGARERFRRGELVAVLSGEQDLRNLVQSPKGEGDFAHKYVLQGCDLAEFERQMMEYVSQTNIQFESPKRTVAKLHRLTGGNLYVMRMILWGLLESRVRGNRGKIRVADIPRSLDLIGVPGIYGAHVFRHGIQLIAFDPDCWADLETLIKKGRVKADPGKSAPSTLEMAGIALLRPVRKQLEFASELHKDFVNKYYDARRLGDLYANNGNWEAAFRRYKTLPPAARIRPAGVEDLAQIEGVIRSLGSSLYMEAARSAGDGGNKLSAIEDRFINGCRYLLGFSEISFWHRDSAQSDDGWWWMETSGGPLNKREEGLIASFLPEDYPAPHGPWELPARHERHRQYAVITIINLPRDGRQVAVVLSDLANGAAIHRERARLARMLLEDLARAYIHTEEVNHVKRRLDIRDQQVRIMNSIFGSLGSKFHDVNNVLERAARGLNSLGYRRVIFSLVDPEEEWIRGVIEKSDDDMPPPEKLVNVRLSDENNRHAQVVRERAAVAVPNARKDPNSNPYLVKKGGVKAYALIPMVRPGGHAIGTIHVERKDGALPSEEEMSDLKFFGKQLAIAIEQIERVNLLETALDRIPE